MQMIYKEKWTAANEKEKMQICHAVKQGANERAISKEDYILMFNFLLEQCSGSR